MGAILAMKDKPSLLGLDLSKHRHRSFAQWDVTGFVAFRLAREDSQKGEFGIVGWLKPNLWPRKAEPS
jgi:hypothetical protein